MSRASTMAPIRCPDSLSGIARIEITLTGTGHLGPPRLAAREDERQTFVDRRGVVQDRRDEFGERRAEDLPHIAQPVQGRHRVGARVGDDPLGVQPDHSVADAGSPLGAGPSAQSGGGTPRWRPSARARQQWPGTRRPTGSGCAASTGWCHAASAPRSRRRPARRGSTPHARGHRGPTRCRARGRSGAAGMSPPATPPGWCRQPGLPDRGSRPFAPSSAGCGRRRANDQGNCAPTGRGRRRTGLESNCQSETSSRSHSWSTCGRAACSWISSRGSPRRRL